MLVLPAMLESVMRWSPALVTVVFKVGEASNGLSAMPVGPFTPIATSLAGAMSWTLSTCPTAALRRN